MQYPEAEHHFAIDMACFQRAVRALAPEHAAILDEIAKHFDAEESYFIISSILKK